MQPVKKVFLPVLTLAMFILITSANAYATTYYIDYSSGADTNSGTSKTAPWQHAPGMQGCTGACSAVQPQPGDQIIFKGGVTWPNACFNWLWQWSGTASNYIYIGVDKTWYSGNSWTRPIFDAGGTRITAGTDGDNMFMCAGHTQSYFTIDDIEWKGLYWTSADSAVGMLDLGESTHINVTNCYFHGWSHDTFANGTRDNCYIACGYAGSPYNVGVNFSYDVWDGGPNGSDSCAAFYHLPNADHCVVRNMSNGFLTNSPGTVHDCTIGPINQSFDSTDHENCIETTGGSGAAGPNYFYNNVLHDCKAVNMLFPGTGSPETDYIFNNVLYSTHSDAPIPLQIDDYSPASGEAVYIYNNTIDASATNLVCARIVNRGNGPIGTFDARNNFCVSSGGFLSSGPGATNLINTDNITMTPSQASAAGISLSQTYVDQQVSSNCNGQTNCPNGAGVNLTSLATGNLAALAKSTTYGCTADSNGNIACPSLAVNARPANGAWDIGAFVMNAVNATGAPQAPGGLRLLP